MKILNVVPVNSDVYTPEIDNYVRMYLGEDTVLDTVRIHNGSPSIECEFDEMTNSPYVVDLVIKGEKEGYDTVETLTGLAEILREKGKKYGHPIYIIADEPYRELVYGDTKVPFIPCIYNNTIVCYSYSKSLSLPGERIGYVYVPEAAEDGKALFAAVAGAARIGGHVCPPTLIQMAIERCAKERPDLAAYDENRLLLYNSLTEMGYECAKPDGAFYLFVKAPNGDAVAFSETAKLEHNLLVVPGDGFGCPGYFRLSYCVSNDMIKRSLGSFKALIEKFSK